MAIEKLSSIYKIVNGVDIPIKSMSLTSAEITKISINTFLTLKISYANIVGALCNELSDADKFKVCEAIGEDSRIGEKYLNPGIGFGGPCLPRDTRAFGQCLKDFHIPTALADGSSTVNAFMADYHSQEIINHIKSCPEDNPRILCCGFTYKRGSLLLEESHALKIMNSILSFNNKLTFDIYDESAEDVKKYSAKWKTSKFNKSKLDSDLNNLLLNKPDFIIVFNNLSDTNSSLIKTYSIDQNNNQNPVKF